MTDLQEELIKSKYNQDDGKNQTKSRKKVGIFLMIFFLAKKVEKYFSSKIKYIVLALKRIQRRASNSLSKCCNVPISYFFAICQRPPGSGYHLVE